MSPQVGDPAARAGRTSTLLRLMLGARAVVGRAVQTYVLFRSGMTWRNPALYVDGV